MLALNEYSELVYLTLNFEQIGRWSEYESAAHLSYINIELELTYIVNAISWQIAKKLLNTTKCLSSPTHFFVKLIVGVHPLNSTFEKHAFNICFINGVQVIWQWRV